ncbi:MAG: ferritin [Gemmatimonadetes bacterium GWC2_71_9]|jgi:ferritin|nr:MAG: ferritin [Gemmatimonadetes bacterium GWC2_71_9]OGT95699.1 MAG: ferritin [Gemmatimonadetes bacterium RIFCSPLOWO2_02_FULL_71_11]
MLSKKMQAALNAQINAELYSAYLYLSMSAHCEAANLTGFAAWMRRQAREESQHAMKIFDYVTDRDGRVTLDAVGRPPTTWKSPAQIWERVLEHERHVSKLINDLYALAVKEKDFPTEAMLQWFLTEQVEEEKTARQILEQVKMLGPSGSALFFLDRHVGKDAGEKGEGA